MDTCRVNRTDLESPITELTIPDLVLEAHFRQQLQQRYADLSQTLATNDKTQLDATCEADPEQAQNDKGDDYEFRLFTRPSASGLASACKSNGFPRITLRSPSPTDDGLNLTSGGRPNDYYFTGDAAPELAEQYTQAAVSGQDIIEGLRIRWTGMELPWRVTVIKTTEPGKVVGLEQQLQAQTNRRKRSGKKRRILIRQKLEARAVQEVVARQKQTEKEAAEREKRTRRNREKKVKKKQKDQLKKMIDVQDPV